MPLFEVVITEEPKEESAKAGELERLVLGPKLFIAKDAQMASFDAFMECQNSIDRARMRICIRPF